MKDINTSYEVLEGQTTIFDNKELFGISEPVRKKDKLKKDFMNPPVAVPTEEFLKGRKTNENNII